MTPAKTLLALCEEKQGAEDHDEHWHCPCVKRLAAALKVCVEGLRAIHAYAPDRWSDQAADFLSEAARLASEGE